MKKLMAVLLGFCVMLLSGCETGEVQHRLVVHALGIDKADEGYEISYQVFTGQKNADSGPVDASESTVITLISRGNTLCDAEESLKLQTGKDIFLGDVELIIISEELKDESINDFLQYSRNADVYLGVNVVYCRGKAKDTLSAKLNQGSAAAILLRSVLERTIEDNRACSSRIIEISNILEDEEAIAIPILTLEQGEGKAREQGEQGKEDSQQENSKEEDSTLSEAKIRINESLIVSPDGPLGEIDSRVSEGIRLLRGDAKNLSLEPEVETAGGEQASVRVEGIKIKRKLQIREGVPFVSVDISGKYSIRFSPNGADEKDIVKAAEEEILMLCAEAQKIMEQMGADLVNLKKLLTKYKPEFPREEDYAKRAVYSVRAQLKKY